MLSNRLKHSITNAKTSLFFYFVMLFVNLYSRKVFLTFLGDTSMGVASSMNSIVGLLNMAEIGITTAIVCALFTPIYNKDKEEINRIISIFCFLFRIVGIAIMTVGFAISFFTPYFIKDEVNNMYVYLSFFVFLFTTSLSYFVNYKQFMLFAAQKTYIVTKINNLVILSKIIFQVLAVKLGAGYVTWILLEAVFAIIYSVILERRIKKEYAWLKPSYALGKKIRKEYKHIFGTMKQVVSHKFANIMLTQTDTVVIGIILSATMVTHYVNYAMISSKIASFTGALFSGIWAGVGNLISEGDEKKIELIFKQYCSISFFLAGIVSICVWYLATPFVSIVFGKEYVLDNYILLCIVLSMLISIIKQPTLVFLNGYSLYKDVWAAWTEAALNILISVIGGIYWGLLGVILGTVVSTLLISALWKPYFLFKEAFKKPSSVYFITLAKYVMLLIISFFVIEYMIRIIYGQILCNSIMSFILWGGVLLIGSSLILGALMYISSASMRDSFNLIIKIVKNHKNRDLPPPSCPK